MKVKIHYLVLALVASTAFSFKVTPWTAPPPSRNIVIDQASDNYTFAYNRSKKTVEIKQSLEQNYSCLQFRDKAYFAEFFDQQSSLDEIELLVNGSKYYTEPKLEDYESDGIFFSDQQICRLTIDLPAQGSKGTVRLKKTVKDPRYFCTIYFDEIYPVIKKEITLVIPRWMKVEIKEFNFEGYDIQKTTTPSDREDADIIKYTVKNLAERANMRNLPGPSYILPHLLILCKSAETNGQSFTYFNTLADQYKWYTQLTGLMKNDPAIIKEKALEITSGTTDDIQKVKKVLYWVYNNIRYVAFEDGLAGFKPDEAQNVLKKKYGDCKGMANLTKELLKSMGYDARLCWIGTNHIAYDYSTPSLCVDNHMICYLFLKGQKYFLDGTETWMPLNLYAERIQGRQVLIENGSTYILDRIPATTYKQNLCQFREQLSVHNNALQGQVEYVYRGESKEQLLDNIHSTKKEKLSTALEIYITNNNKNYLATDINTSAIDETDGDFSIKFKSTNAGAVSSFDKEMYIDIDYNKSLNQASIDTAKYRSQFRFPYKYNFNTETNLDIPAGYKVTTLPQNFEYDHPDFHFSVSFQSSNNKIIYKKQLYLANTLLKKTAFTDWNKAIAALSEKYSEQVVLTKIQ